MLSHFLSHCKFIVFAGRWIEELTELGKKYVWVQIFENKGAIMGCSNPHPHCQIWASSFFPNEPRIKEHYQLEYYKKFRRPLLMDYVVKELEKKVMYCLKLHNWDDNKTTCKLICLSMANTLFTDMIASNALKNLHCDKIEDDKLLNI